LALVWSPAVTPTTDISLFAQLIGYDGMLWSATQDPSHPVGHLAAGEIVIERFTIHPLLHAVPGDYALTVGAYSPDGRFTSADGADAVRLTTISVIPATLRPVTARPAHVRFAGGPTLIGVDYDTGAPALVRAYLHWAGPGAGVDAQVRNQTGTVIGQKRIPALERSQYATLAFDFSGSVAQVALLDGDQPRRRSLLFGAAAPLPSHAPGERYVSFGDSLVLTGVDGPRAALRPEEEVTLALRFLSRRPLERDYIISTALHGINADGTWDWRADDDSVPALGAIPTLKWIHNSSVFDPHQLSIPADPPPTFAEGQLVIYDHFTQIPLPPLDERLHLGHAISLGTWPVASR
jgi:hypothetical protein